MGRRIAASVSASAHLWHPIFVLISLLIPCVTATGKGPVGSYAINHQYILVSDSNFDALFVVDVLNGSGIVATIALHSADLNPPTDDATFGEGGDDHMKAFKYWVDPTGVASCDECKFIYFTSQKEPNLGYIELDRPLLEMAKEHDFSSMNDLAVEPKWQSLWSNVKESALDLLRQSDEVDPKTIEDFRPSKFRMLEIHRDGSRGYLTHYDLGVFVFTLNMSNGGMLDQFIGFLPLSDASSISGLTLTPDGNSCLIITAKAKSYLADFSDEKAILPRITQTIELETMCGIQFKNGNQLQMNFRDAVMDGIHGDIYAIGKPYGSSGTKEEGFGAVLFRLSKDSSEGSYTKCVNVANKLGNGRGWRDGHAEEVRFTRPHSMIRLPDDGEDHTMYRDVFILPDIDNRGMRRVDLDEDGVLEVSSLPYDADMWKSMYEDTTLRKKRKAKAFVVNGESLQTPNSATFSDASAACSSTATTGTHRRLCRVDEIRESFDGINNAMIESKVAKSYVKAWTNTSCHGCWLHYPGFCKGGEGWDESYRMVAHITPDSDQLILRTQCTSPDESIDVMPLCCEELQEEEDDEEELER